MKLVCIVGARPNFVKVAPFLEEATRRKVKVTLVHTGQHYDNLLSDAFFRDLDIPAPDVNLGVHGGTVTSQIGRMVEALGNYFTTDKFDFVVVFGDTNSTVAAALAAKQLGLKLVHIESGLRSGDWSMPEEVNRVVTDRISDLMFVTEKSGVENLAREGITENVHLVGNLMIDSLKANLKNVKSRPPYLPRYGVVTLHRAANVDDHSRLTELVGMINHISDTVCPIVFPLHPRTSLHFNSLNLKLSSSVKVAPPFAYLDFIHLLSNASFVLTDSGGIQEETTWLGKPCLTLRENTERPVTITEGTNTLVGFSQDKILGRLEEIFTGKYKLGRIPRFWDGDTSSRILDILIKETKNQG